MPIWSQVSKSEGSSIPQPPPSVATSRWEMHAPKLSATPVPRCVMDIAMGRDHLQNNQPRQQNRAHYQGGLPGHGTKHSPSIPRQLRAAGRVFLHSELFKESSQSKRGDRGICRGSLGMANATGTGLGRGRVSAEEA